MATVTRVNGDFKQVMNQDSPSYTYTAVNAVTSGVTVNTQGPKLDFFTITLADIAANTTIALTAIQTIQQKATIAIYEFTDTGTDTLALALYPTGAYTAASLTADIDAALGGGSSVSAQATFTN